MKLRKWVLATALCAGTAFAQQNVDISGKDFSSGAGDAKLATIGRQAAASGKRIVVTAPQEWHAKIAAKIRSGGAADIVLKDGFYENVLVRVEDKPAEPAKPEPPKAEPKAEPKPEPRPEPKPAPKPPERVPVEVPGPKPTLPPPAPVVQQPPPAPAPVAPAPVAKPAPATPTVAATPAAPQPDVAKIKKRLEQSLNNGREAEGTIEVAKLQNGDFVYVDGPVRAIVRREGLRPRLFWLAGDLDLRRTELKPLAEDRYQIIEPLHGENYSLRDQRADQPKQLNATVPADNAPARAALERDFNDGHTIGESITVEKLRAGDVLYTGNGVAVVVRREGASLGRYWLEGSIDLSQSGLQKDGGNKYKVISDTIR